MKSKCEALRYCVLPFEVRLDESNQATYAAMEESGRDEDICGLFDSVDDLMEVLNA